MVETIVSGTMFIDWLEAAGIIPEGTAEVTINAKIDGSPVHFSVEYWSFKLDEIIVNDSAELTGSNQSEPEEST